MGQKPSHFPLGEYDISIELSYVTFLKSFDSVSAHLSPQLKEFWKKNSLFDRIEKMKIFPGDIVIRATTPRPIQEKQ